MKGFIELTISEHDGMNKKGTKVLINPSAIGKEDLVASWGYYIGEEGSDCYFAKEFIPVRSEALQALWLKEFSILESILEGEKSE